MLLRFNELGDFGGRVHVGNKVRVLYNPSNPSEAENQVVVAPVGVVIIMFVLGSGELILGLLCLLRKPVLRKGAPTEAPLFEGVYMSTYPKPFRLTRRVGCAGSGSIFSLSRWTSWSMAASETPPVSRTSGHTREMSSSLWQSLPALL